MRKLVLISVILLAVPLASAEVFHDLDVTGEEVRSNMSLKLTCDDSCPVSVWTVTMKVPEDSYIREVRSSEGRVKDYKKTEDEITVETDTEPTESEKITVNYVQRKAANDMYGELRLRTLSLPAFSEEQNSGEIQGDLIHASISPGFDLSAGSTTLNFTGTGPANIFVTVGEGFETRYYEFFGDEPENTSISYEVPVGVLGFSSGFERLPVSVMPSDVYNETVNEWSAGQYVNATLVTRNDLDDGFRPILAHETVHALNDRYLDWDTRSSWFDEGISRYIEYLTKKALEGESRTRNVFWEKKTYTQFEDGSRYRYKVPSKSDKESLWNYYQNDRDFMKNWRPEQANREFGYAYSELVIRNYVMRNGSIKELYKEIEEPVESDQEKWGLLSTKMDLRPCDYESRDIFEECLEKINEYEYPVYRADNITDEKTELIVERIQLEQKDQFEENVSFFNRSKPEENRSGELGLESIIRDFLVKLIGGF